MTPIRARSRSLVSVPVSMESSKARASSGFRTGVLPFLTTCLGPRTGVAGLKGGLTAARREVDPRDRLSETFTNRVSDVTGPRRRAS